LTVQDQRLFKVLGQSEAYEILLKQREKADLNTVDDVVKNFIKKTNEKNLTKAQIWQQKVVRKLAATE
jgi:hypothetical protein